MAKKTENMDVIDSEGMSATSTLKGNVLTKDFSVISKAWGKGSDGKDISLPGTVQIDFDGVPMERIYDWASRALIVNLQRAVRDTEYAFAKNLMSQPIKRKASEMGLGFSDPSKAFSRAMRDIDTMPEEQLREMLNIVQAALKK